MNLTLRALLCGILLFSFCANAASRKGQPNIVLILADDLGWADLGCYGNTFNETPNIDRLAGQGMRFTDFYAAAAVCSPTRASIMAGQSPARLGMTAHIPGHWRPFEKLVEPPNALHLPTNTISVAQRLRDAGYKTGYFGKWHLGGKDFGPERFGFETVFEFTGHEISATRQQPRGTTSKRACAYLGELADRFIEQNHGEPFFLQISPYAVHIPLTTTPELQKKYEQKPTAPGYSCHPTYAGLLEELDSMVGAVRNSLERAGLIENTLFIFTSENGGLEREVGGWPGTMNRPLRDEKGSLYEGGIRVPLIVRWPGTVKAGSSNSVPTITTDFYPTFLDAAKIPETKNQSLDGTSLLSVLKNPSAKLKRENLFWHYPHYHHSRPAGAIRSGDWKLIEFFDSGELELYNLRHDISEAQNLATHNPRKKTELQTALAQWRHSVNAQMPQANPAYNPERANEWWSRAKLERTEAPGTPRK
ncbi:MAG: sulfatase [Verrucomicrobia bacterium]|nr:sulfatase [Verrucomicrobiota bacterium]